MITFDLEAGNSEIFRNRLKKRDLKYRKDNPGKSDDFYLDEAKQNLSQLLTFRKDLRICMMSENYANYVNCKYKAPKSSYQMLEKPSDLEILKKPV